MTLLTLPGENAARTMGLGLRWARDARYWQILALGVLLTFGMAILGFDQKPEGIAVIIICALATQAVLTQLPTPEAFLSRGVDPLSALITSLSLSLLLRADNVLWLGFAAMLAITSKFLIRVGGKHVFNPANFAIIIVLALGQGWISPSQWGAKTWAAFLFASLAGLVLTRARRADMALAFLLTFAGFVFARAAWLGDPWAIPLKQMQSGALLLFAFFMITDPRTTPDARADRILYAVLVALAGAWMLFERYTPEGLMIALFLASPLVPLIDRWRGRDRATRFQWSRPTI